MSQLDHLIARAKDLTVRDDHARLQVAELSRWVRPHAEPSRTRLPWFAGGFAIAAAAAVIVLLVTRPTPTLDRGGALRIGDRVAIIAEPNTRYRVLAADARSTEVFVEHGTVTARLWPGAQPHRLALRGEGIEAVATGTVFALQVDDRGASVHVHEGKVEVTRGSEHAQVAAGTAWPVSATPRDRRAAEQLLAMAPPLPSDTAVSSPTAVRDDAPAAPPIDADQAAPADARASHVVPTAPSPPTDAAAAPPPTDAAPPPTMNERYRRARLQRGQGNFDAAIRECLAIADAKDATWSPIALLEAARIELGPRASPERAIVLADRFIAEWSTHELAPEARELRCRALRQLGRDAECKPKR